MTEALGLTPSQTAGPYLSIGLLRELVPTALVDPGDPRAIRHPRSPARWGRARESPTG